MPLSPRDRSALRAISQLPLDGEWRRATYRNQLHELAGLSRGALTRSLNSPALAGLVVVQGVGRSARLPEGYKLTEEGVKALREAGPVQPIQPRSSPPIQSVGSSAMSFPGKKKERIEPTNELGRSSPPDPAPLPGPFSQTITLEFGQATRATLYAALTGTPICACVLPMVVREQGKTGMPFWGCLHGKGGCGVTLPYHGDRRATSAQAEPPRPPRPANDQSTMSLADALKRTADARRA